MKNAYIFILISFLAINFSATAQTAVNFTEEDCDGNSFTLFDELDAGKIIVITWVMPCGSCQYFGSRAYDAVQSFTESHLGMVEFYLTDDYADHSCSSISSWGTANNMENHTAFSSNGISMSDYGEDGMPKVVVLGGSTHEVLYNENNGSINEEAVRAAIGSALTLSITEPSKNQESLTTFPNPSNGLMSVDFFLEDNASLVLYTILGEQISSVDLKGLTPNKINTIDLDLSKYAEGTYLLQLNSLNRQESTLLNLN